MSEPTTHRERLARDDMRGYPLPMRTATKGVVAAVGAFLFWGFTPLYWALLDDVGAFELILYRILMSFPLLWSIVLIRRIRSMRKAKSLVTTADPASLPAEAEPVFPEPWLPPRALFLRATAAGVLVTVNWLTYVWAVTNGHTLDASLGYYINPLVSVALGTLVLRERLGRMRAAAVAIALGGVVVLTIQLGSLPWLSLVLATSFGVYGLIKKQIPAGPTYSLALELVVLFPPTLIAVVIQVMQRTSAFVGADALTALLLVGAGLVTVVPLVLFGYATQTIRLSDVGFIQYIAPTCMLLLGVYAFGESLDVARLPGFILVWVALALYSVSGVRRRSGS